MLWKDVLMWIKRVLEVTKKTYCMIRKTLLTTKNRYGYELRGGGHRRWYLFIIIIIMSEINYNVRKLATDVDRAESVLSALETSAELAIAKFFLRKGCACVGDSWVSCWRSGWVPCERVNVVPVTGGVLTSERVVVCCDAAYCFHPDVGKTVVSHVAETTCSVECD